MKKNYSLLTMACSGLMALASWSPADAKQLLYEDFAKCTAGTVDLCDDVNIGTTADDPYGTGEIDTYTELPGWSGYGIYQAGGTVVIKGIDFYGSVAAGLQTPNVACAGNVTYTARVRIYPEATEESQLCSIIGMDTKYNNFQENVTVTKEWQEVTVTKFCSGDWNFRLSVGDINNYNQTSVAPVQVDWVKVEQSDEEIQAPDAPVALPASNFKADSFTANWEPVDGAECYYVYVTYQEGEETKFFMEGVRVNAGTWYNTAKKVSGIDPTKVYSYYVTAERAGKVSEPSNIIDVVNLITPELIGFTDVTATGFTANWVNSPMADNYTVTLEKVTPDGRADAQTLTATENTLTVADLPDDGNGIYTVTIVANKEFKGENYTSRASFRRGVELTRASGTPSEVAVSEDFAKFANGSETEIFYKEYDNEDPNSWGPYVNAWSSKGNIIPAEYTAQEGWTGMGVAEAGGAAAISYMPYPNSYMGGYIKTPEFSAKGIVTVKFRIRAIQQYAPASAEYPVKVPVNLNTNDNELASSLAFDVLGVSDGYTINRKFYQDYVDDSIYEVCENGFYLTDNDWHDVYVKFYNYSAIPVHLNIGMGYDFSDPFFIDDIEISVEKTGIDAPVATEAAYFVEDGFTAFWQPVADAESYLLSVYRRKAGKNDYAFQDKEVQGTSYDITGLDPNSDYFFTVKAKAGNLVSIESNAVAAMGISTPVALEPSNVSETGFTANWKRTPKATRYDLIVYKKAGSRYMPLKTIEIEDGDVTGYDVADLDREEATDYAYDVRAYYDTTTDTYTSELSNRMELALSGVNALTAGMSVKAEGQAITVIAERAEVVIFDAAGRKVAAGAVAGQTRFNLGSGLYIVSVNGKACKVIL